MIEQFAVGKKYIIGIDEAGRPQSGRASPRQYKYHIGIDEAGRGPLAGPVVVAGIKIKSKIKNQNAKFWKDFNLIKDSKKLSARQRELWFAVLTKHPKIDWAFAKVGHKVVDRINIARAANLGVLRVYRKLSANSESIANLRTSESRRRHSSIRSFDGNSLFVAGELVLLDGGLKLPISIPQEIIIKGDEKVPLIAAASIIAKVVRDRTMLRLHKKYPQYRFDMHKGYGTKLHKSLIKQFGVSDIHRRSFKIRDR